MDKKLKKWINVQLISKKHVFHQLLELRAKH